MSDFPEPANRPLTDADPSTVDGQSNGAPPDVDAVGPPDFAAPEARPGGAAPNVGQRGAPVPASAAGVAATGEPGTLPSTWCKKCQADVLPEGKGRCPRCKTFLHLNFVARRHPVNKARKQQLLDQLVADYRPSTTMLLATCEHLAGILEQLEVLKPGSPDHQRLVQLSQQLADALQVSRPPESPTPAAPATPEELERSAMKLLEIARLLKNSAEFARHRCGYDDTDGGPLLDDDAVALRHAELAPNSAAGGPVSTPVPTCGADPVSTFSPAPEPTKCEFCHQSPCIGPDHDAYDVLHWSDPVEQKKRDAAATEIMMRQVDWRRR